MKRRIDQLKKRIPDRAGREEPAIEQQVQLELLRLIHRERRQSGEVRLAWTDAPKITIEGRMKPGRVLGNATELEH